MICLLTLSLIIFQGKIAVIVNMRIVQNSQKRWVKKDICRKCPEIEFKLENQRRCNQRRIRSLHRQGKIRLRTRPESWRTSPDADGVITHLVHIDENIDFDATMYLIKHAYDLVRKEDWRKYHLIENELSFARSYHNQSKMVNSYRSHHLKLIICLAITFDVTW